MTCDLEFGEGKKIVRQQDINGILIRAMVQSASQIKQNRKGNAQV